MARGQALQRLTLQHHMHHQLAAGAKGRLGQGAGGGRFGGQQGVGGRGVDHRVGGQRIEGRGRFGGRGHQRRLDGGRGRLRGQGLVCARGAVEQSGGRSAEQGQPAGGQGEAAQQSAQRGGAAGRPGRREGAGG